VIKIRYADLPEGLHARAEAEGGGAVIYLLRGLSPAQRRVALRRVRRAARLGNGPRLSASGVALAAAMDTAKSTTRNGIAAVRFHPAGSLFLTALFASVVVCYVMFVSVSIHLIPSPPGPGGLAAPGGAGLGGAQGQRYSAASPGGPGGPGGQQGNGPGPSHQAGASAPVHAPVHASASASAGGGGGGSSQLAAPSPVPLATSSSVPPASPSPGPTGASPAPSRSGSSHGGLCVNVGPLGVCLSVQV
jgi:hypothetical protein